MNASTLILLGIPVAIYQAWVLMTLWGWFIVPLGLPSIGLAWAYGIRIVYALVSGYRIKSDEEMARENTFQAMLTHFLFSTICLAFGYVAWRVMR